MDCHAVHCGVQLSPDLLDKISSQTEREHWDQHCLHCEGSCQKQTPAACVEEAACRLACAANPVRQASLVGRACVPPTSMIGLIATYICKEKDSVCWTWREMQATGAGLDR